MWWPAIVLMIGRLSCATMRPAADWLSGRHTRGMVCRGEVISRVGLAESIGKNLSTRVNRHREWRGRARRPVRPQSMKCHTLMTNAPEPLTVVAQGADALRGMVHPPRRRGWLRRCCRPVRVGTARRHGAGAAASGTRRPGPAPQGRRGGWQRLVGGPSRGSTMRTPIGSIG